jgi:hypothetical protein
VQLLKVHGYARAAQRRRARARAAACGERATQATSRARGRERTSARTFAVLSSERGRRAAWRAGTHAGVCGGAPCGRAPAERRVGQRTLAVWRGACACRPALHGRAAPHHTEGVPLPRRCCASCAAATARTHACLPAAGAEEGARGVVRARSAKTSGFPHRISQFHPPLARAFQRGRASTSS